MDVTRNSITKLVSHPMEDVLGIAPGTTEVIRSERVTELVEAEEYDEKDAEIEEQFQEIYDAAMGAFEAQMDEVDVIEGKYKARTGEIAVQFLNAALNAAREKGQLKQHKDKVAVAKGRLSNANKGGGNGNMIIADRNELLRHLRDSLETPVSEQ